MKGINKKWVGYCLYGVLLTLVLLYYRFPSEAVKEFVAARAGGLASNIQMSVQRVSPSLTFGLELQGTEIYQRNQAARPVLRVERFFIRPEIWKFIRGQVAFSFEGALYGGALTGRASWMENNSEGAFSATVDLEDVLMDQEGPIVNITGRDFLGTLGGRIVYKGRLGSLARGRGEANLTITGGRIELLKPILGLESIDFSEVRLKATLNNRRIMLSTLDLKGQLLHGTLSGQVFLNSDLLRSTLDLRGSMEPYSDLFKGLNASEQSLALMRRQLKRGKLPFVIRGTIKEPVIRFL